MVYGRNSIGAKADAEEDDGRLDGGVGGVG